MTQAPFVSRRNLILKSGILFVFLLFPVFKLSAQTNFSGTWTEDKSQSDDFYKSFKVKCIISQTKQSFTIATTFSDDSDKEIVTRKSTFPLDGKEATDSEGGKQSAKWSTDKKELTTSDTKDYGGDIVGVRATYSISENGQVLTIKTSDVKPDVKTITQVFNKSSK